MMSEVRVGEAGEGEKIVHTQQQAPADRTLIFLNDPRVDACLVVHVHARQQPDFIAFG